MSRMVEVESPCDARQLRNPARRVWRTSTGRISVSWRSPPYIILLSAPVDVKGSYTQPRCPTLTDLRKSLHLLSQTTLIPHRWAPAVGRESKAGSRSFFQQDFSARTKLKFRTPGQGTASEVGARDLKAELARAEREAADKKRKAKGLPPLGGEDADTLRITEGEDEQVAKRKKLLEEAAALDADDSDDETSVDKGKGKA